MSKINHEAIAKAMVELEDDIHSLNAMAQITADLLDDLRFERSSDGGFRVCISEQERDIMDFAACNVCARALTLKERFIKATHGVAS